jgi:signal transduction histidine kinase
VPIGVLFIGRDLALSREVDKLRRLDQLKDEFVHTVSHELKTPLTAILGGTEILMLDLQRLEPDQRELLQIVDEGSRRLRTLIDDLLDLSRLEGGRVELYLSDEQLSQIADQTIHFLAARGPHRVEREYRSVPRVRVDRDKIRQVFENLLSNAIKYSPGGGAITIRITQTEGGEAIQVDIADQGIGIARDQQAKVFEKFYRVDASTTAQVEGTGLGLSITQHLVELHGGKIWLDSAPGRGSTFSFTIPLERG